MAMRRICLTACAVGLVLMWSTRASASSILYSNMAPNGQMAVTSHPSATGVVEVEAADDFVLTGSARITEVQFIGLVPSLTSIQTAGLNAEFYRVFPADSNTSRTPTVPTRANSPSDVAFAEHTFGSGDTLNTTLLGPFAAANSIANGGISLAAGGNGAVSGQEVTFDLVFANPITLPAGHYFFVPQVAVTGGSFDWLSAQRPLSGPFAFTPDLQAWVRDGNLDPDWLRVGTDIVGGSTPPTFNMAFAIIGDPVPEPATLLLVGTGFIIAARRLMRARH